MQQRMSTRKPFPFFICRPVSGVFRYPTGIPTSVRGIPVPYRYPDQCQGYSGTLQVSWPVSGVFRYPAGILASVRGIQVPCRYPDQCQGFAGTLQVFRPVSGVFRYPTGIPTSVRGIPVPCRYPDQCQGFAEIGPGYRLNPTTKAKYLPGWLVVAVSMRVSTDSLMYQ